MHHRNAGRPFHHRRADALSADWICLWRQVAAAWRNGKSRFALSQSAVTKCAGHERFGSRDSFISGQIIPVMREDSFRLLG